MTIRIPELGVSRRRVAVLAVTALSMLAIGGRSAHSQASGVPGSHRLASAADRASGPRLSAPHGAAGPRLSAPHSSAGPRLSAPQTASGVAEPAPHPAVRALMNRVDKQRALLDLRKLAGDEPICFRSGCEKLRNRMTGTASLSLAVDYVAQTASDLGYDVEVKDWRRGRYEDRNVFVTKRGVVSPTVEVYFVAHVDGIAQCPGKRCPAADDNASGSVAGLELARAIGDASFQRTIVMLFSTGEEQSMQGVRAYIERMPPREVERIAYVVNLDMVGYDSNDDNVLELYHDDHPPSLALARFMQSTIEAYGLDLVPLLNPDCG